MSHLLPDTCPRCDTAPAIQLAYHRRDDTTGETTCGRLVCRDHLAAALEEVASDLLGGRVINLAVITLTGRLTPPAPATAHPDTDTAAGWDRLESSAA